MIAGGIQFHNTAELEEAPFFGGQLLRRFPAGVRHALSERGRWISGEATGCELRFVTDAPLLQLTLLLPEREGEVAVYRGGLLHSTHLLQAGGMRTLHLEAPPRLAGMDRTALAAPGFAPEVWRVIFGRTQAVFLHLNTFGSPVRPPEPEETPQLRWMAYGSSITHGLMSYSATYIDQAARRLQADVFNKGMSGSCLCEREMADFLAEERWDVLTLELGVNMRESFTPEAFAERTRYLLEGVIRRQPDKPVVLLTIFPNFATQSGTPAGERERRFNEVLREQVSALRHPHLHLIEGNAVLQDLSGLSCDLIHPGSYGHMRMGEELAARMREVLIPYGWPLG